MPNSWQTAYEELQGFIAQKPEVRIGKSVISIWENSPTLARLRQRELLKSECGICNYKLTCSGCRGRAYEETGDMMAAAPGCWLGPEVAKRITEVTNAN